MPQTASQIAAWAESQTQPVVRLQPDGFQQIRRDLARGGRPTTLEDDIIDRIGDTLAEGHWVDHTCGAHGIPRRTYYHWLERGEKDAEQGLDTRESRFWHTVKAAKAQGLMKVVNGWYSAGPGEWQKYATAASRLDPENCADKQPERNGPNIVVQIGGSNADVKVLVVSEGLSPTAFAPIVPETIQPNSLETQAFAITSSPINRNYVNQPEATVIACQAQVEASTARPIPEIPAQAFAGDPTHPPHGIRPTP